MSDVPVTLVIGYGNTLRRDDGVGPLAAEAVRSWDLAGVATMSMIQLTPEIAEPLSKAKLAIFIDARIANPDGPFGVQVCPLEPAETGAFSQGHSGDPRRLLALAREVFGFCPPAWLMTVPAADLELGEGLSPLSTRGLADALSRIALLLKQESATGEAAIHLASTAPRT